MTPNVLILALCALVPFLIAFVWFHPKVFGGTTWAQAAGLTQAQSGQAVKPFKMFLTLVLNFLMAFGLFSLTVHQSGVFSLVGGNAELLTSGTGAAFLAEHGKNHLTLGHGMFHGIIAMLCFVLPILAYATIFERKTAKYLFINAGFWLVSMMVMGAIICKWAAVPV